MSIRPRFAAFRLEDLRRRFGTADEVLFETVARVYAEEVALDQDDQDEAEEVLRKIVSGQASPADEDDTWQSVMACFVDQTQNPEYSESMFWEALMVRLPELGSAASPVVAKLVEYLEKGRPLIGEHTVSSWAYYAYFTNQEARQLFSAIQSVAVFATEFDFAAASEWMNRVSETGADVWFYAS